MGKIAFKELNTPEAFVTKYLAKRIGLNIRHGNALYNRETKEWTVPLRAIVPSRVKITDNEYKTFVYRFEDIGSAMVTKVNDNYKFVKFPSAHQIDDQLHRGFTDITKKMEKTLLKIGKNKWGHLSLTKWSMRPLYDIVSNLVEHRSISRIVFDKEYKLHEYLQLLKNLNYVMINERSETNWVMPSNEFTILQETISLETKTTNIDSIVAEIVGIVFAEQYGYIRQNLGNRPSMVYVDTTKAYYLKAVQMGESIPMTTPELLSSFKLFQHSTRQDFKFSFLVNELVSCGFLAKDYDDKIIANEDVLDAVMPLRQEILASASEVQ